MPGAGFRVIGPRNYSSLRAPYNRSLSLRTPYNANRYNGNRFVAGRPSQDRSLPGRPSYDPRAAGLARGSNQDRFDARRRQFQRWYVSTYPYWPGFPYLLDPNFYNLGLYDWGDSDDSAYDNSASGSYESDSSQPSSYEPGSYDSAQAPNSYISDQDGPPPLYPPYPNQSYPAPLAQAGAAASAVPAPAVSAQPLTVIFLGGRAPIEVENYLMTAKVLTDLDSEHFEQIPLDQIDLAATKRFNTFAGVDFQIPAPSRN